MTRKRDRPEPTREEKIEALRGNARRQPMKRKKLHNPFYPKPNKQGTNMGTGANNQASKQSAHIPPAVPSLTENSADAELWLDIVTSAVKGYCGAAWAKEKGPIQMVSSQVVIRAAVEVADGVFAEYKKRCGKS